MLISLYLMHGLQCMQLSLQNHLIFLPTFNIFREKLMTLRDFERWELKGVFGENFFSLQPLI